MVDTLDIVGCEHILVSTTMLAKEIATASEDEIGTEKDKILAVCYILRSNENDV